MAVTSNLVIAILASLRCVYLSNVICFPISVRCSSRVMIDAEAYFCSDFTTCSSTQTNLSLFFLIRFFWYFFESRRVNGITFHR